MNLKSIRELACIAREYNLESLECEFEDAKIKIKRSTAAYPGTPVQSAMSPEAPAPTPTKAKVFSDEILSPMVGIFYAAPGPESEPFVQVGSSVRKGDVLCILEAMKLMNEIKAERDGEIAEICVENGQLVEHAQVLFRLR